MQITKVAKRYSSALLQIAKEQGVVEETLEDIKLIRNTLKDSRDLVLFLKSPIIKRDDKIQVLEKLFKDKVRETTYTFLELMAKKRREELLEEIVEAYVEQYNEYAGIKRVDVYSAKPLSDEQRERLKKILAEDLDKNIDLRVHEDEKLIGGLAVRIDDTIIDGTVKHKLEQLEDRFFKIAV